VTKRQSFRGVTVFLIYAYVLILYVTSINIFYSISIYNRVESENKHENDQYGERESAIMGLAPIVYNRI